MMPKPVEAQPALVVEVAILLPAFNAVGDLEAAKSLLARLERELPHGGSLQVRGVRWS